jgi:hypothetical protein
VNHDSYLTAGPAEWRVVPEAEEGTIPGLKTFDCRQRAEIHGFADGRDGRQFLRLPRCPGNHSGKHQTGQPENRKASDSDLEDC